MNLNGFDVDIGGRKGDKNLQGGETELCARMQQKYEQGVWYDPEAKVAHKVFNYRTKLCWLIDRAFWQGYSKRAMESFVEDSEAAEETAFLASLVRTYLPRRICQLLHGPDYPKVAQLMMLIILTAIIGVGYLWSMINN
ncbi:MAG: hypothetical protein J07HQW2_02155 [Haloquadratum walsbyi J07HQW2]|uniref:Uncharacterized protein n=1 Tax=Haloquadratum walsbyi J07HQW2 TaxID=1238425 RepID=U1NF48_9EURY|nr:MAG: hypothetical protein J07HQW2_02155 [Haloquadratum walsbyi J07HQW2]